MALIVKIARFLARLNEALNEAMEARLAAQRRYPHLTEE
jgi:hypothetical protein